MPASEVLMQTASQLARESRAVRPVTEPPFVRATLTLLALAFLAHFTMRLRRPFWPFVALSRRLCLLRVPMPRLTLVILNQN